MIAKHLLPAGMIAKYLFITFIICFDKEQKATQVSLKKSTYIFHILETVLRINYTGSKNIFNIQIMDRESVKVSTFKKWVFDFLKVRITFQ